MDQPERSSRFSIASMASLAREPAGDAARFFAAPCGLIWQPHFQCTAAPPSWQRCDPPMAMHRLLPSRSPESDRAPQASWAADGDRHRVWTDTRGPQAQGQRPWTDLACCSGRAPECQTGIGGKAPGPNTERDRFEGPPELRPISRSNQTRITRPNMKNAIRIAAKQFVVFAPVHTVSHALS